MKAIIYTKYGPPEVLQLRAVGQAISYLAQGHTQGKVVITVAHKN